MADIELVIKIPEEIRLALINNVQLSMDQQSICDSYVKQAIINGTPLPKGHEMMKDEICIQDKYDKKILARRYGNVFDCNNCGRSWIACKDDTIEGYELYVKLRCPYCHNMIDIPRNFNWF